MKETLVMSALKLQVANKIMHEDQQVISSLRKDAAEAKKLAVISSQKEADASMLVESLRVEISTLKRQVREKTDEASSLFSTAAAGLTVSDAEVDQMMASMNVRPAGYSQSFGDTGGSYRVPTARTVTPFQEWKLQQYIWSPDIPRPEDIEAEKMRLYRGEGEDPGVVAEILDDTFHNIKSRHSSRNKKRPPSTPFGNAMERARSRGDDALRAQTAGGGRRAHTAPRNASSEELLSSKFPGISKIRQRVSSAQQVNRGELDGDKSIF